MMKKLQALEEHAEENVKKKRPYGKPQMEIILLEEGSE